MWKFFVFICFFRCRYIGRIIKDVINMGFYNFFGMVVRYDEFMRIVKEVLEVYGVGVVSIRYEMGMYVYYLEILFSWVLDVLCLFFKFRVYLDCVF